MDATTNAQVLAQGPISKLHSPSCRQAHTEQDLRARMNTRSMSDPKAREKRVTNSLYQGFCDFPSEAINTFRLFFSFLLDSEVQSETNSFSWLNKIANFDLSTNWSSRPVSQCQSLLSTLPLIMKNPCILQDHRLSRNRILLASHDRNSRDFVPLKCLPFCRDFSYGYQIVMAFLE